MVKNKGQLFPKLLLKESIEERVKYFYDLVFMHKHLEKAYNDLFNTIIYPDGIEVICVFGPTGAGKSKMAQLIVKRLVDHFMNEMIENPDFVPSALLELEIKNNRFDWREHNARALEMLGEVLIPYKLDYTRRGVRQNKDGQLYIESAANTTTLGWALTQCLRYRKPKAYIWDEAQLITKVVSASMLTTQMEIVKSLAQQSRTIIVLVGTYDLLPMTDLTDQSCRRIADIHLPRYHIPQDTEEFKRILRTFQRHMPLDEEPDLVAHYEYFYERCAGIMAVIKHWFTRALRIALTRAAKEGQRSILTIDDLETSKIPKNKLASMVGKIEEGERFYMEMRRDTEYVCSAPILQSVGVDPVKTDKEKADSTSSTSNSRKPGQRKPGRDRVGLEDD